MMNADMSNAARSEGQALGASGIERFEYMGIADIFKPLPPIKWLCKDLDMAPGAPTLVAGYGFSGKTVSAQSAGLSIVAGMPLWGTIPCSSGRIVHIDYEQGARLTQERYQRLARAAKIDPRSLDNDAIRFAPLPSLFLSESAAEDACCRICEGAALLIVDSLRASAPGVDENDSNVRGLLDTLTRVSEKTGVVSLIIHHAKKPSKDSSGGARMSVRGSSGIYDAASSVLVMSATEKGGPVKVEHEKARNGGRLYEEFYLKVEDVLIDNNPLAGLRVAYMTREQVDPPKAPGAESLALQNHVVDILRKHPGAALRHVREEMKDRARVGNERLGDIISLALERRVIVNRGTEKSMALYPAVSESN